MNLLHNYAKSVEKRGKEGGKKGMKKTIKCRKMVTKVCILGIEVIFSHFLNNNMEKII